MGSAEVLCTVAVVGFGGVVGLGAVLSSVEVLNAGVVVGLRVEVA